MPRLKQVRRADAAPEVLAAYQKRFGERDPVTYRELAILRTGFAGGSRFVFSQHSKFSRAAGLSEEKVAAVPARVQDATFERLKRHFDDEQILELTYVTCLYKAWATFARGLRLEFDDVEERVTEVPAPAGGAAIDMKSAMLGEDKVK
jgi:alkylhydroperoxidase family enzyme